MDRGHLYEIEGMAANINGRVCSMGWVRERYALVFWEAVTMLTKVTEWEEG